MFPLITIFCYWNNSNRLVMIIKLKMKGIKGKMKKRITCRASKARKETQHFIALENAHSPHSAVPLCCSSHWPSCNGEKGGRKGARTNGRHLALEFWKSIVKTRVLLSIKEYIFRKQKNHDSIFHCGKFSFIKETSA